jgi:hypothetical protein
MSMPMYDVHGSTTTEPSSGTRAARASTPPPAAARSSADEEAMRLMLSLARHAQVATSFAKLAGGLLSVTAAQASLQLRAVADAKLVEMKRIARAATEAAVHVATTRTERATDEAPETQDAPSVPHAAE